MGYPLHVLCRVELSAEELNFVAEAIEALEKRVELAVVEVFPWLRHRA
jgi:hypothetical protein